MTNIIMTSAVGTFTFDAGTKLSQAKVVRDAITAQMLKTNPRWMEIENVEDAYRFIRNYEGDVISRIQFHLTLHPELNERLLEVKLRDFAKQAKVTAGMVHGLAEKFGKTAKEIWTGVALMKGYEEAAA